MNFYWNLLIVIVSGSPEGFNLFIPWPAIFVVFALFVLYEAIKARFKRRDR